MAGPRLMRDERVFEAKGTIRYPRSCKENETDLVKLHEEKDFRGSDVVVC